MCAAPRPGGPNPREGTIPVAGAALYYREIGQGLPVVVLHGGPDFDCNYLLPDLDRLADACRLIYYDQRGRGRSSGDVRPGDVSLRSEIEDLEALRRHFGLGPVALLGHSWGGVLALEYALRYPGRVSRLVLANTGPASRADFLLFRQGRERRAADDLALLQARSAEAGYREADPDAVAAYYRIHFRSALRRQEDLDRVIASLRAGFTREGILKARQIEDRLMAETWLLDGYDLLPKLARLRIPTLVIHGEDDFIPLACAAHVARAIPGARFVALRGCGHFAYLECPETFRSEVAAFLRGA